MEIDTAIAQITADDRTGATALAERAAEVLAEAASQPGHDLTATALAVARAQPAMAPLLRLANDVLLAAERAAPPEVPEAVRRAATEFAADLRAHAQAAAEQGARLVRGSSRVLTHSASSVVAEALLRAHRAGGTFAVVCTESRPTREGTELARRLGAVGITVHLIADAAAAALLPHCDRVLLGADTVCAAGLVHKVGTLGIAVAARHQGVPVHALATDEKLLPQACGSRPPIAERDPEELIPAPAANVAALNFYYDVTPRRCLAGIVTEQGLLPDEAITRRLSEIPVHEALRGIWCEVRPPGLLP